MHLCIGLKFRAAAKCSEGGAKIMCFLRLGDTRASGKRASDAYALIASSLI